MRTEEKLNLTMLCDFYELTMGNGYFQAGLQDRITYFDVFFRNVPDNGGFAVCAGLENLGGAEFGEIWAAALELLDLSDPARAALLNLGGSLGRYGAAEQAAAISACEQELRREAERAAQEAQVMGRLRAGLAAGAGLILAIVLY